MAKRKKHVAGVDLVAWKQRAQNEATALFGGDLGDIWGDGDDYDLFAAAEAAFRAGQSPEAFIREAFAEDLARSEGEDQEHIESLCQEEGYE